MANAAMPMGGGVSFSLGVGPNRRYCAGQLGSLPSSARLLRTYKPQEEEAEALYSTTPHERPSATERIGKEEHKDQARHDLDDAINALCKQGCVSTLDTEALEHLWCVIVDGTGLWVD